MLQWRSRLSRHVPSSSGRLFRFRSITTKAAERYPVFQRLALPPESEHADVNSWIPLLELGLPPHLRRGSAAIGDEVVLHPIDIAHIAIASKFRCGNLRDPEFHGLISVLCHLGAIEGRWDAAMWLVRHVIDNVEPDPLLSLSPSLWAWDIEQPISSVSANAFSIQPAALGRMVKLPSLDLLTQDSEDEPTSSPGRARREFLGLVWLSLGEMILKCADGITTPAILEMMAYLHHKSVIPHLVYDGTSPTDEAAIQQPPTLHLLSSRILSALSDAAYTAHQREQGVNNMMPQRSTGLRPEICMELVLWACLHGGWLREGFSILQRICAEDVHPWRPLSWRSLRPAGHDLNDWHKLDYFFSLKTNSRIGTPAQSYLRVQHTISSEIVDAYIDAMLNNGRFQKPQYYQILKSFLERANVERDCISWSDVIIRLLGSTDERGTYTQLDFSPWQKTFSTSGMPHAHNHGVIAGLWHRSIRQEIQQGNLKASCASLRLLCKDLASKRADLASDASVIQGLPSTILASFLDLVLDNREHEHPRHQFIFQEIDGGPLITRSMFQDDILAPALVRWAAETNDKQMLSQVIGVNTRLGQADATESSKLSNPMTRAFLDAQIKLERWPVATRLLQYMEDVHCPLQIENLACLALAMLRMHRGEDSDGLERAKELFACMIKNLTAQNASKGRKSAVLDDRRSQVRTILVILACIDSYWAKFCASLVDLRGWAPFTVPAKVFNFILEGAVEAYGSAVARHLIETFWSSSFRRRLEERQRHVDAKKRSSSTNKAETHRSVIAMRGLQGFQATMYGGLRPDVTTFRIMLRQVHKNMKLAKTAPPRGDNDFVHGNSSVGPQSSQAIDNSPRGILVWIIRCLRQVGLSDEDIFQELQDESLEHEMAVIRELLPDFLQLSVREADHLNVI